MGVMSPDDSEFRPDWFSAPGESIEDILEERKISVEDFARGLQMSREDTDSLLRGELPLTDKIASRLEALGFGAEGFWQRREQIFRERQSQAHQRLQSTNGPTNLEP